MPEPSTNSHASVPEAEYFRRLECTRLQSLVEVNMEVAGQLHAPEFHLITPSGRTYSRESYLGAIKSGQIKYVAWTPGPMEIRVHERVALIRYQATLQFDVGGSESPFLRCWHTDAYEFNDERWQVVWSQATTIK